jgi:threonine dehydrogenase-like Zn-dependent dehydrogenase
VHYCGICGSDLPVYRWDYHPAKWEHALPRVMGHEFAGEVAGAGPGVDTGTFANGVPVAVEPGVTCGHCAGCRRGFPNLCEERTIVGIDCDGAFARYVTVPARNAFVLERGADFARGAFLEVFAIGVHVVERARLEPNDRVLVLGAGPIGISAAALARVAGCDDVVVAGIASDREVRLPAAEAVGAAATTTDLSELDRRFDVVVEASGSPAAVRDAVRLCRTGGRVVAVGTTGRDVALDWDDIVLRAVTISPVRARLDHHWLEAARLIERVPLPGSFFQTFPLARVDDAFQTALAGAAVKVLIEPTEGAVGSAAAQGEVA